MKNYFLQVTVLKRAYSLALAIFLSLILISCEKTEAETPEEMTVLNVLESFEGETATTVKKAAPAPGNASIAQIAIDNVDFDELVSALVYVDAELNAGLVNLFLNGKDQYTVFAPTDGAFQNLYDALGPEVDEITDLPAELVLNVLLYHVTEGRRASNSVVPKKNMRTIQTLLERASFKVSPDLKITAVGNTANILAADISASNGIIHIIDTVLLPIE